MNSNVALHIEMPRTKELTVTLLSNSNMKTHPTNRGNKFTVKLAEPLNFGGQTLNDDNDWEVALTSVQYTNRFYDVRDTATIYVVLRIPIPQVIGTAVKPASGVTQYAPNFTEAAIRYLPANDAFILRQYVKAAGSTDPSFVAFGKIVVRAGHYKDPSVVHDHIVTQFNKMFGPRYNTSLEAVVKGTDGTLTLHLRSDTNVLVVYTDKAFMVNLLGFSATDIGSSESPLYRLNLVGTRTPRFDAVQSLFIYSDIAKPQHVGDTMAPLMETIPVEGSPGQRIVHRIPRLSYVPVNRNFVETISVEICDGYGNHVQFPDDVENVTVRLSFKRASDDVLAM